MDISKTADRALQVLIELGDNGPRTPAELSRSLGLNRTVVHRLLTTLQDRGFVARRDDGYVPSGAISRIADRIEPELRAAATPTMERLAADVGETVIIHIRDDDAAVVLQQVVPTTQLVRVEHRIGSRHSLTFGASGRALLAYLEPAVIARLLRSVTDPDHLRRQLDGVRAAGYAVSHDELQHGVYGLAVPVRARSGAPLASLAILVPSSRASVLMRHVDVITRAAEEVDAALGSSGVIGAAIARPQVR